MDTQQTPIPPGKLNVGDRKYKTEDEAKKAGATWWRAEAWPQCLYKKLPVGRYYYRARSGGSRAFLQLETDDYTVATRRLRDKLVEVFDRRDNGETTSDFKTLGACAAEMGRIVERSDRDEHTRRAYRNHVARLRAHWLEGKFDTCPAIRVNLGVIMELRSHLNNGAVFVAGRVGPGTKKLKKRKGYANNIVNQTLWALKVILDIAVEKRVLVKNPFSTKSILEKKINLPRGRRTPDFPSTDVMEDLFVEMRVVKDHATQDKALKAIRQKYADRDADLAQFMAYTGARHYEALNAVASDDGRNGPGLLFIDGTKSRAAKRDVPVMLPGLRPLLDKLKKGKEPDDKLFPEKSDCLKALARACLRLGIKRIVQHELRHYFATVMLEKCCSFRLLAEWLGHADGGVLAAKTYGHIRKYHAIAEADRIRMAFEDDKNLRGLPASAPILPALQ